jgi:hypothetical protein
MQVGGRADQGGPVRVDNEEEGREGQEGQSQLGERERGI